MELIAVYLAGVLTGWLARRFIKRRPKQEDRNAGLRRYQAMKHG